MTLEVFHNRYPVLIIHVCTCRCVQAHSKVWGIYFNFQGWAATVLRLADTARRWMVYIFQRLSCTRATTTLPLARKHSAHSSRHMNNPLLRTGICQNDRYGPLAFGSGCLFISLELRVSKSGTALKRKKKISPTFSGFRRGKCCRDKVEKKKKNNPKPGMCVFSTNLLFWHLAQKHSGSYVHWIGS